MMAAVFSQQYYTPALLTQTTPKNATQEQVAQKDHQTTYQPPTMELSTWGKEAQSFEDAKDATGISSFATLPSSVPTGLKIASIRTNVSPLANYVSVFYAPAGVTATDNDTFGSIMGAGGMLIIYSEEKVAPEFNQTTWLNELVSEGEGAARLTAINGETAILVDGNQTHEIPSEVLLIYPERDSIKTMTDLMSLSYSSIQLEKIAQSIGTE
jgi:hypothetical protein